MFVGADSMNPTSLRFFRDLNITILEIYGLSETTGPHTTNLKNCEKYGHCGCSINGVQTKITNKTEYTESKLLSLSKSKFEIGEVNYAKLLMFVCIHLYLCMCTCLANM